MHRFIGIVLVLLLASPASANLLSNGSLESGTAVPASPGFVCLCPPSTLIDGWTVTHGGVDYASTALWDCADGVRSIDLDGSANPGCSDITGGISTAFATTPGRAYLVSFWLAGNTASGPAIKTVRVTAAGQQADFTFDITGRGFRNMGWTHHNWSFTANATSTTLEFFSVSTTGYGPVIDNVVVDLDPTGATAVEPRDSAPLVSLSVFPNPSINHVSIVFTLPNPAPVSIAIYDVLGRQVFSTPHVNFSPGTHSVSWDGSDRDGNRSPGIYLIKVSGPGFQTARRIVRTP